MSQPGLGQQPPGYPQQSPGWQGQQFPAQAPESFGAPYASYAPIPRNPGRTVGIWGLVLSFFGPLAIAGLICSITGMVKSKRAGTSNGIALAGLIISILMVIGTIIFTVSMIALFSHLIEVCNELGPGTHYRDGVTYTCG